jgi:hypothetical protein
MRATTQLAIRKWIIIAGIAIMLLALTSYALAPKIINFARTRTEATLRLHFESDVQFSDFQISLFPRLHVTIRGLVMRHKGRTDIPPLVEVRQVSLSSNLFGLFLPKPRISFVQLDGLQIHTPPREPGGMPTISPTDQDLAKKYPVLIGEIRAYDALLVTLHGDPKKAPREFPVHYLELRDVSFDRPATFHAELTNPVPVGEVDSTGAFGPWQADQPSLTPVDARYTFRDADMSTLKGLKGTLSSTGKFSGPLDYLNVEGETDIPNFSLRTTNQPVALHTDFTAVVDGTNGDTILKSVTARFLHTTLVVSGKVVDADRDVKGRTILLDAISTDARVEDLLRLAVKSDEPVMTGAARLKTNINIPEGDGDLLDRLKLDGQFGVGSAQFTKPEVQEKIDRLSRKGQGQPKDTSIDNVVSELKGSFLLNNAVVSFRNLSFSVTGARLRLSGTYNIDTGEMDFHGKLMLDAKLSQTTTGVKSFFLKAADPFFKGKHGGAEFPIKITGTKDNPSFGLDSGGGAKKPEPEPPRKSE